MKLKKLSWCVIFVVALFALVGCSNDEIDRGENGTNRDALELVFASEQESLESSIVVKNTLLQFETNQL